MRLTLSLLLLSAIPTMAGVITSVSITGSTCNSVQSTAGETTANASASCPGASGSASANLFSLGINGSKSFGILSQVLASAAFDYSILVTGTDQPGFLLIYLSFSEFDDFVGGASGTLAGQTICRFCVYRNYLYIPYSSGVPVELAGLL